MRIGILPVRTARSKPNTDTFWPRAVRARPRVEPAVGADLYGSPTKAEVPRTPRFATRERSHEDSSCSICPVGRLMVAR